ncbi:hypothetical protein, partial [Streptococcus himalayensis]|uniref:hypothetical protein n=1 Tax=Streptococcus himalayensis TaxID=1888195 RepID=UPI001E2ACEE2
FYTEKGSIISTVDLPTTDIIEPQKSAPSFPSDFDELPIDITSLSDSGATVFTFLQTILYYKSR